MGRRAYGSGSLYVRGGAYYGHWRTASGQQIKRKVGLVRTPADRPDGLTKTQAEARLRDLMRDTVATAPLDHARTLSGAAEPRRRGWPTSRPLARRAACALQLGAQQAVPADVGRPVAGPDHH